MRIAVDGSFEMAHRLTGTPGSCTQLHGHSWKVHLEIAGTPDANGIIEDFRTVKKLFRAHLEETYDHQLLLNSDDRLAPLELPGLRLINEDPTTENIAKRIGQWAEDQWGKGRITVTVRETDFNSAVWP